MTERKKELAQFKKQVKRKFGTLKRFSIAIGMDEYALRKLLMRINMNSGKYVTEFDSKKELERLKQLLG
jgi:hypothetical protein